MDAVISVWNSNKSYFVKFTEDEHTKCRHINKTVCCCNKKKVALKAVLSTYSEELHKEKKIRDR